MNLDISESFYKEKEFKKYLYNARPADQNGLILNINQSKVSPKVRFIQACFSEDDQILACLNNNGQILLVNLQEYKFWTFQLLSKQKAIIIKFSAQNFDNLLIGFENGDILINDINSGIKTGELISHKKGVQLITFSSNKKLCLTSAKDEGILWSLEDCCKLRVLNLENNSSLKFIVFMPISNNVLACFDQNLVQIWSSTNFESMKQIAPSTSGIKSIRNIAFTKNGNCMVLVAYLPILAIFSTSTYQLIKLLKLPDNILSIKYAHFIATNFDGGFNKILAILSGNGTIYFYNIEENAILSELQSANSEINKFYPSTNGTIFSVLLCSGEVQLYNITQYIKCTEETTEVVISRKIKPTKCDFKVLSDVKNQIDELLEIDKLKAMLKEFGQYPASHRLTIWEKLLHLPNNRKQYNRIINRVTIKSFENLSKQYPLDCKNNVKNLKKLLNNLVSWSPFFAQVDYLPVFAFPFVKVFQNRPIACFEALCTIIINWCQHWFEYFPLTPVNILSMTDNLLLEHDPELVHHFATNNISPNLYIWALLETSLSEVLSKSEWLQFWDHILTNEPAFLLCAVAAYSIHHRNCILEFKTAKEFEFFFHHQNANNLKALIQKTYFLLNSTSDRMHPSQYLREFKNIECYPKFLDFPKTVLEFRQSDEKAGKAVVKDFDKIEEIQLENEENSRQIEMEKAVIEKARENQQELKMQRKKLKNLRDKLQTEEELMLQETYKQLHKQQFKNYESNLDSLLNGVKRSDKLEANKLADQYVKLLECKYELSDDDGQSLQETRAALKKREGLIGEEIKQVENLANSSGGLKELNLTTCVSLMEDLIRKIEAELNNSSSEAVADRKTDFKLLKLQAETRDLEKEVGKLMDLLADNARRKKQ